MQDLLTSISRRSCKDRFKSAQGPLERKSWGSLQDLRTRTYTRPCKDIFYKKISSGPLKDLLTRTCTRSCKVLWRRFQQGLYKDLRTRISWQGSLQDLPTRIPMMKIVQGPLEWISARYLYKDLRTKIPRTSSRKNLLTGALQDLPHKDLHQLFSQGPVQDHAKTSWKDFSCISVRSLGRSSAWDFKTTFHVKPAVPLSSKKAKGSTMGGPPRNQGPEY